MPHKVSDQGSYRIDLRFPSIGRIALASGAHTKPDLEKRKAMLRELYDAGKWDVLKDLQERRFSLRQLYAHYISGRVGHLSAEVVLQQPLAEVVEAWLPVSAKAAKTRERYTGSWSTFKRLAVLPATAVVRDIDRVDWQALQQRWPGGAYNWRHLRGFISRLLTVLLRDKWHPMRRAILDPDRFPSAPEPEGRVPDLTPLKFWEVIQVMPEITRAVPVGLVVTGMRIGELRACVETDLRPLTYGIRIPGRETKSGRFKSQEAVQQVHPELWDWVKAALNCTLSTWTVRDHWRTACKKVGIADVTLHDLRHCYGQWLVNEGVPESSVQRGLRHRTPAMTRRYVTQRDRQINADAMRDILLRSHSGSHSGKPKARRKRA